MEFFQDPNVIYLLLMAGLWISAAGAYIPGTGVAEIGGAALIVGTLFLLSQMAANWIAVIALVIGASLFFLLPLLKAEWERFAVGGPGDSGGRQLFPFRRGECIGGMDRAGRAGCLCVSPDDSAARCRAATQLVVDAEGRIPGGRARTGDGDD